MFGIERRKKVRLTREFTIACNRKIDRKWIIIKRHNVFFFLQETA